MAKNIYSGKEIEEGKGSYEISFIIDEKENENLITAILHRHKTEILFSREAQKFSLAYLIKNKKTGYFGFTNFIAPKDSIPSLKKDFSSDPHILRFILISWMPELILENQRLYGRKEPVSHETREPQPVLTNEALEAKIQEMLKE